MNSQSSLVIEKLYFYSKQKNLDGFIAKNIIKLINRPAQLRLKYIAFLANCSVSAVFKFINLKLEMPSFYQLKFILTETNKQATKYDLHDLHLENMIDNLRVINQNFNQEKIGLIIKKIYSWQNIWIVAKGDTFSIADDFALKLKRIGISAHTIRAESEINIKKLLIKQGDGIIFISISGNTVELVQLAKYVTKKNINSIIFTSNDKTLLNKNNHAILVTLPKNEPIVSRILLTVKQYYIFAINKIFMQIILENTNKIFQTSAETET